MPTAWALPLSKSRETSARPTDSSRQTNLYLSSCVGNQPQCLLCVIREKVKAEGSYISASRRKQLSAVVTRSLAMGHKATLSRAIAAPEIYAANSSSSALASFRSRVSKPSVNHPYTGANSSRACCTLPWSRQRRARTHCGAEFPGFCLLLTRYRKGAIKVRFCLLRLR